MGESGKSLPRKIKSKPDAKITPQDTSKPEKIKPVSAPTGMYQGHYELFVLCAAERLDRIGRDLPDPAYVASIETNVRTFLRRVENNSLIKELEHLAFLMLLDEEQNRTLSKEDLQTRLRLVFDGVKGMEWKWCGVAVMGQMPNKKAEHPTRAESIWQDVLREWKLYD